MLLLTAPPASPEALSDLYARTAREGMVHSAPMRGESFDMHEAFDPAWACESVSWNCGGEETYRFAGEKPVALKSSGALVIGRGARYAYRAGAAPYLTSMIAFPAEMSAWLGLASDESLETDAPKAMPGLRTGVRHPSLAARALMYAMANACRAGAAGSEWFEERAALLYGALLADARRETRARGSMREAKEATRRELARRAGLAADFMHAEFTDPAIDLRRLASEARLSRFHFVRVFTALYGETPMDRLSAIRADAAARLLAGTKESIGAVARNTGFADRTTFYRQFKQRFGISPKAFRERA